MRREPLGAPVCSTGMLHHVSLGTADLERARAFYDPDGNKIEAVTFRPPELNPGEAGFLRRLHGCRSVLVGICRSTVSLAILTAGRIRLLALPCSFQADTSPKRAVSDPTIYASAQFFRLCR